MERLGERLHAREHFAVNVAVAGGLLLIQEVSYRAVVTLALAVVTLSLALTLTLILTLALTLVLALTLAPTTALILLYQ